MRRFTGLVVAGAAASVLALAACGGSSSSGAEVAKLDDARTATGEAAATAEAPADFEEAVLAFTRCLREEGLDVEDPDFTDGAGGLLRGQLDPSDPDVEAAMEECRPLMEAARPQRGGESREALEDAFLEYARCMRDEGIDMPDPDFSGGGAPGGGGFFEGLDRDDPDFQAADGVCRDLLQDALPEPLGGNGPAGGEDR